MFKELRPAVFAFIVLPVITGVAYPLLVTAFAQLFPNQATGSVIEISGKAIGSALITMVEPNVGHEHAYNRWYEDDHFYSGAMHGPWTFAGRRWVAPKALRDRVRKAAEEILAG